MEHGLPFVLVLPGNTATPPLQPQSLKYSNWPFVGRVSNHLPQKVKDRQRSKVLPLWLAFLPNATTIHKYL